MAEPEYTGAAPACAPETPTTPTITDLADRLAAAWEVFRRADADPAVDAGQARRDLDGKAEMHRQMLGMPPRNFQEALIRAGAAVDLLDLFAHDAERLVRASSQAFGDFLAHAEAEGIALHPAISAYFVRRPAP